MAESPVSGPFRASHLGEMMRWTGDWVPEAAAFEYADVIEQNHERGVCFDVSPNPSGVEIPRSSRFGRFAESFAGEAEAQAELDKVAEQWDEITDEIGRESQRKSLRKVTGI